MMCYVDVCVRMLRLELREANGNTSVHESPSDMIGVEAEIAHCAPWSSASSFTPQKPLTYNPDN